MGKKNKKPPTKEKEELNLKDLIDGFEEELGLNTDSLDEEQKRAKLLTDFDFFLKEYLLYRPIKRTAIVQASLVRVITVLTASENSGFHDLTAKFAMEISNILLPLQHIQTTIFIDKAVIHALKTDDKRLKRDILHQAGDIYGKIGSFDTAVSLYLEARKYSDVEIDKAEEIRNFMKSGKVSSFGLGSENFYAMMTLKAARCMNANNDEIFQYFEEARAIYTKLKMLAILGVVDFELGIVYDNRGEFEKSLASFESAKRIWLEESPEMMYNYNVDMQIKAVKQKLKFKKRDEEEL